MKQKLNSVIWSPQGTAAVAPALKTEAGDQYRAIAPKYAAPALKTVAADQYRVFAPKYAALKLAQNLNSEI